jgi:hypothetical protein
MPRKAVIVTGAVAIHNRKLRLGKGLANRALRGPRALTLAPVCSIVGKLSDGYGTLLYDSGIALPLLV